MSILSEKEFFREMEEVIESNISNIEIFEYDISESKSILDEIEFGEYDKQMKDKISALINICDSIITDDLNNLNSELLVIKKEYEDIEKQILKEEND